MSSWSLIAQSTAVPAFLLVKVLAPAFYARQDTRTPVKAAIVAVLTNAICTVGLFAWLLYATPIGQAALQAAGGSWRQALAGIPGAHALLALAIAIAGWVNALQLAWLLRRAGVYRRQPGWARFLWRLAAATLTLVAVVLAFRLAWLDWSGWAWWERGWRLAAMVGSGGVAYAGVLLALGMRPRDLRH
jgi:putative peptidoglycan lipid II flippase